MFSMGTQRFLEGIITMTLSKKKNNSSIIHFITQWHYLRPVGNLAVLKISYITLIVIPALSGNRLVNLIKTDSRILFFTFFANLFLALANFVYDVWCPVLIKRFSSPNDLYEKMLEIRKLSVELYPHDNFKADFVHCENKLIKDTISKPILRWLCSLLFITSGILFGIVLFQIAGKVIFAILF